MTRPTHHRHARTAWVLWIPALLVATGAGVATAHGLYDVAVAAGMPHPIAWLYPLITDGLALVAYASTTRLAGQGRSYAWTVVVLAAGLSGLAQASYLAGGIGGQAAHGAASAPAALRFGVGAWPAIAAAIVAHLLFLLGTHGHTHQPSNDATDEARDTAPTVGDSAVVRPSVPPSTVQSDSERSFTEHHPTVQDDLRSGVQLDVQDDLFDDVRTGVHSSNRPRSDARPIVQSSGDPGERPTRRSGSTNRRRPAGGEGSSARERARVAACGHVGRYGQLPTVAQLMALAEVAHGTAGAALKDLREQPPALQVVHTGDQASAER